MVLATWEMLNIDLYIFSGLVSCKRTENFLCCTTDVKYAAKRCFPIRKTDTFFQFVCRGSVLGFFLV